MSFKRSGIFILLALFLTLNSCRKEEDTIAIINVVNIDSEPQSGIVVRLLGESTADDGEEIFEIAVDREEITDESGKATFDFTDDFELGQAGFAVLTVEIALGDTLYTSIIKVDPEETNEETVII